LLALVRRFQHIITNIASSRSAYGNTVTIVILSVANFIDNG